MMPSSLTLSELMLFSDTEPDLVALDLLRRLQTGALEKELTEDIEAVVLNDDTIMAISVPELIEHYKVVEEERDSLKALLTDAHGYLERAKDIITEYHECRMAIEDTDCAGALHDDYAGEDQAIESWMSAVVNDEDLDDWRWKR